MNRLCDSTAQTLTVQARESDSLSLNPSSVNYLCVSLDELLNLSVHQLPMCQMRIRRVLTSTFLVA